MATIAITGASRGLGLGLARHYLERGDRVLALARDPSIPALTALQRAHPERLHLCAADVRDEGALAAAARYATAHLGALDVLVNNAGIEGGFATPFAKLDFATLGDVFDTNAVGALRASRAFLPLLGRGAVVAMVSSRMGSIADDDSGGSWAYRISKAAMNMAGANLALELRPHGVAVVMLHPGWVRTDMGGPNAPLDVAKSVAGMVKVIDTLDHADTGCFRDYQGQRVPW